MSELAKGDFLYIVPSEELLEGVFHKLWSVLRKVMIEDYPTPDYSDDGYDEVEALMNQTAELMGIDFEKDLKDFEAWINSDLPSIVLGAIKDCDSRLQARWDMD